MPEEAQNLPWVKRERETRLYDKVSYLLLKAINLGTNPFYSPNITTEAKLPLNHPICIPDDNIQG